MSVRYDIIHQKFTLIPNCWGIKHIPGTMSIFEKEGVISHLQLRLLNFVVRNKIVEIDLNNSQLTNLKCDPQGFPSHILL